MNNCYVLFEQNGHTRVLMIRADSEREAWKTYLAREHGYTEHADGTFHHSERSHDSLQDALDTYGIVRISSTSFQDTNAKIYYNIASVFSAYGIQEHPDGNFSSTDVTYADLETVLSHVRQGYRDLSIEQIDFKQNALFQQIYLSRDILNSIADASASDIAKEHRLLAHYYEIHGDFKSAIKELKKCIRQESNRQNKISDHWDLARLFRNQGKLRQAIIQYKHALRLCTATDNRERLTYLLASAYDELGEEKNAIKNYLTALAIEPDLDEKQKVLTRIEELKLRIQIGRYPLTEEHNDASHV